jgi:hypothetical protein
MASTGFSRHKRSQLPSAARPSPGSTDQIEGPVVPVQQRRPRRLTGCDGREAEDQSELAAPVHGRRASKGEAGRTYDEEHGDEGTREGPEIDRVVPAEEVHAHDRICEPRWSEDRTLPVCEAAMWVIQC